MPSKSSMIKTARLAHLYIGVFIAPALIFFAFTGFVQTFSLHETTRGSSYKPPRILVELGQLHKKQTLVVPSRRPEAALSAAAKPKDNSTSGAPAKAAETSGPKQNLLPMKLFFALVSFGLLTSTITGLFMTYQYARNYKLITVLWIAGIVVPVLLTLL